MSKYKYFIILCLMFFPCYCNAKSITCSKGNNYKATITLEDKIGLNENSKIDISSDKVFDATYTGYDTSIVNIIDGYIIPKNEGKTKINISIIFSDESLKIDSCNTVIDIDVVSSDSSLKSLNIENYDISSIFRSDKLNYDINLPHYYDKINIIGEANNESAKITGLGSVYLNEGKNKLEILVSASSGNTTIYTLNINRLEANNDSSLKSLSVDGYMLDKAFSKDIYEYNLNLPNDVDKININASASYDLSLISGTGTMNVSSGNNIYIINVTSESGTSSIYKINVYKNNGSSKLKNLFVKGYNLNKTFSSDEFNYNLSIPYNVDSINIITESEDDEQVEIIGADNLKFGDNDVIIRVTSNDKTSTTYKIVVTRESKETAISKNNNKRLIKILFIIFIISILIMITTILIFIKVNFKKIKKISKNNKKRKK